jgi:hypothetical protein
MLGEHPIYPVLLATDLAATRDFYHTKLGLEILTESEAAITFRCGGGTQLSVTKSTTGTADTQTQASWQVTDLQAEVADLPGRAGRAGWAGAWSPCAPPGHRRQSPCWTPRLLPTQQTTATGQGCRRQPGCGRSGSAPGLPGRRCQPQTGSRRPPVGAGRRPRSWARLLPRSN